MTSLADKVVAIHDSLEAAGLPHAFGGALALAWCTRQPRGTSDIDVNVFARTNSVRRVVEAFPPAIRATPSQLRELRATGQVRLSWNDTPVDLFLNSSTFHQEAAGRVSYEPFGGKTLPFLSCSDLAVFKAFFDRRRDWADLEEMLVAGTLDIEVVVAAISKFLGPKDPRIDRLLEIQEEIGRRP